MAEYYCLNKKNDIILELISAEENENSRKTLNLEDEGLIPII